MSALNYLLNNKLVSSAEGLWCLHITSPEGTYNCGERHFSEGTTSTYDLARAEYFFKQAAARDPQLPYVYHELARIAFLRGEYATALGLINIQIAHQGDKTPNSYYVRGLIEGYMGEYSQAVDDYKYFLKFDPQDWAGINDCAWVLLKDKRPLEAAAMTEDALRIYPKNPWLLSTSATALWQLGIKSLARERIQKASDAVSTLTDDEWSHAYPGNDPEIAGAGVRAFKKAVAANLVMMTASSTYAQ